MNENKNEALDPNADAIHITPTVWPLDTTNLRKGDVIPVTQIEQITGRSFGTSSYQLDLIQLIAFVRGRLWERGLPAIVVSSRGSIRVLTDSEALTYNQKLHDQGIRKARRGHLYQTHVDVTGLDANEIAELDRSITIMGATLAAVARARRPAVRVAAPDREDRPKIQATQVPVSAPVESGVPSANPS